MISLILLPTCTTLLAVQLLMGPTQAFKRTSNVDEYLVEDQRTRLRQNYILQRALNNGMHKNKIGLTYVKKPLDSNTNPEDLPELIVDYADMIRNDIILLDNSVETRTRKRGKVEKFDQDGVPCTCEYETKENIFLGHDYYPASLETYKCNHNLCPPPYRCLERVHNITVLRRKRDLDDFTYEEFSQEKLPADLKRWVGIKTPVTVGCMCTKNYSNRT